jgi:hypothetical protein
LEATFTFQNCPLFFGAAISYKMKIV